MAKDTLSAEIGWVSIASLAASSVNTSMAIRLTAIERDYLLKGVDGYAD